ncbi:N-acetylmuramoyl-L-alanine amidase family protein [Planococcus lenghuensis]|uniref:MurNAc-LAA domain-containing protein n=1 Tax=Planococcus lenghuensis TaxID=2213202 RepID=A0A1Q2KYC3_9BACL|nr:N-acetylmuramoyl-L-alanine amidase [Planococcus lenghuensis]AQQ53201.1 hypothetical protein B0X71_08980 [Planococcus lenghuensis]
MRNLRKFRFYYAGAYAASPYVAESRASAIFLQARIRETWNLKNRGVNPFGYGNLHVLRENTKPAAFVETGFIDSSADIQYLKSDFERKRMGCALYLGVLDYFYHYKGRQDVLPLYNAVDGTTSKRLH